MTLRGSPAIVPPHRAAGSLASRQASRTMHADRLQRGRTRGSHGDFIRCGSRGTFGPCLAPGGRAAWVWIPARSIHVHVARRRSRSGGQWRPRSPCRARARPPRRRAVELVTVSSPLVAEDIDSFELSRRATASGWPAHAYSVLHGDDVAQVLVDHVRGRQGSLLVMATSAKRPLIGRLGGSVSTRVLALTDRPVLLVGPMVSPRLRIARPTLVVGVGPMEHAGVAVSTIASWTQTFPGDDPWVVEVVATAADRRRGRGGAPPAVRRAARRCRRAGVVAGASGRRTRLLVGGFRRARR